MAQIDLTPKPGHATEVLTGGPFNGLVIHKTTMEQVNIANDPVWIAVYVRREKRLCYLLAINRTNLLTTRTDRPVKGM